MASIQDLYGGSLRAAGIKHFTSRYGLDPSLINPALDRLSPSRPKPQLSESILSWADTGYGRIPFFHESGMDSDLFHAVGCILSGHLEKLSIEEKREIAMIPVADIYEKILFDALSHDRISERIKEKPLWPNGKRFALFLSHDVDEVRKTYQYITRPLLSLKKGRIGRALEQAGSCYTDRKRKKDPYWTFDELMNIEESLGVRSTSYFLQEDEKTHISDPKSWKHYPRKYSFRDPKVSAVLRSMSQGGWDVGLHGSLYSYMSREKLAEQKRDLEKSLGSGVCGTRQHHLNLKIPDTWRFQEATGLAYDTSLGYKDMNGFRWGTCFPFHPIDPSTGMEQGILELPLAYMDTTHFSEQGKAWPKISALIDTVERQGGLFTVLFHHSVFNDSEYPGWTDIYRKLVECCRKKNAWIATGKEINDWWRMRA